jgi:hypothetical protein
MSVPGAERPLICTGGMPGRARCCVCAQCEKTGKVFVPCHAGKSKELGVCAGRKNRGSVCVPCRKFVTGSSSLRGVPWYNAGELSICRRPETRGSILVSLWESNTFLGLHRESNSFLGLGGTLACQRPKPYQVIVAYIRGHLTFIENTFFSSWRWRHARERI